jgi:hypothetical protein
MKRKYKVKVIIIFFLTISFILDNKSLFAFTPSDQGKWWNSLSKSEQIQYITGIKDGYEKFIGDIFPFLEKKGEFKEFYKYIESQSSFFRHMYDIDIKVLQKCVSDLYKDPSNTYIEPYEILCVAIDKLEGKSIESELQRLRGVPWKLKKIMEEQKKNRLKK